jgi:hypothetical protein
MKSKITTLNKKQLISFIISIFLGWRIALLMITFYGLNLVLVFDPENNRYYFPSPKMDYFHRWAIWDANYFLDISRIGYTGGERFTPFFPFYPLLIRLGTYAGFSSFWSAFLISQIATIITLYFLYKLADLEFGEDTARKTVFMLLAFPTSFYLGAVYSEPVFLALSIGAFYFALKKDWLFAAILAGLSAATRLIGVAVIAGIFVEYFLHNLPEIKYKSFTSTRIKRISFYLFISVLILNLLLNFGAFSGIMLGLMLAVTSNLFLIVLISSGAISIYYIIKHFDYRRFLSKNFLILLISFIPILIYMGHLQLLFNNPLQFLKSHEEWGRQFSSPIDSVTHQWELISPHLFEVGHMDQLTLEFFSFLFLFALTIISLFKLRPSYYFYMILSLLIPLSSGKLLSFPRIVLVVFPIYLLLAKFLYNELYYFWIMFSLMLLGVLSVMFINGNWVA